MRSLPKLEMVEEHLLQLFVKRGNRPTTPREAFRTVALDLELNPQQLTCTVIIGGRCRNAWQYRCEMVWRDLEIRNCVEQRTFAAWALTDETYRHRVQIGE